MSDRTDAGVVVSATAEIVRDFIARVNGRSIEPVANLPEFEVVARKAAWPGLDAVSMPAGHPMRKHFAPTGSV